MVLINSTGAFRKLYSRTRLPFTYPIGTTGAYTPVTLNFTSGAFSSAHADAIVVASEHPDNTSATDYINRYWTISSSGITVFSCNATFNFLSGDVTGNINNLYCGEWNGAAWIVDNQYTSADQLTATVNSFGNLQAAIMWHLPEMFTRQSRMATGVRLLPG